MKLKDLLQVINTSNYIITGIHVLIDECDDYEMLYMGKLKTKEETERIIERYGERKVKEIDTSTDEGKILFIELGE